MSRIKDVNNCQAENLYKNFAHCKKCGCTAAVLVDCEYENEIGNMVESEFTVCPVCDPLTWFSKAYSGLFESDDTQFWLERLKEHDHLFWQALATLEMKLDQLEGQ